MPVSVGELKVDKVVHTYSPTREDPLIGPLLCINVVPYTQTGKPMEQLDMGNEGVR